jgi:hypothetical protein
MGELQGQNLDDVAPPSKLWVTAAARAATLREKTEVRLCWVDPEINNEMLLAN